MKISMKKISKILKKNGFKSPFKIAIKFNNELIENFIEFIKQNPDYAKNMEEKERVYFQYGYNQDAEDILDDFNQPGAIGVGIKKDKDINGWVYGYEAIYEDNLEDIDDLSIDDIECYNEECRLWKQDPLSFKEKIKSIVGSGKVLYVSNFMIEKNARLNIQRILQKFLEKIKNETQYEYLCFNPLKDTQNLLFEEIKSRKLNKKKLGSFGVELVFYIKGYSENEHIAVAKILR